MTASRLQAKTVEVSSGGRLIVIWLMGSPRSLTTLSTLLLDNFWKKRPETKGKHLIEPFTKPYQLSRGNHFWQPGDGTDDWPATYDQTVAMIRREVGTGERVAKEEGCDYFLVIKDLSTNCQAFFRENPQELDYLISKKTHFIFLFRKPEEIALSFLKLFPKLRTPDDMPPFINLGITDLQSVYLLLMERLKAMNVNRLPLVVRHDMLIKNPSGVFKKIAAMLGVPFSESLLTREPSSHESCMEDPGFRVWAYPAYGRAFQSSDIDPLKPTFTVEGLHAMADDLGINHESIDKCIDQSREAYHFLSERSFVENIPIE